MTRRPRRPVRIYLNGRVQLTAFGLTHSEQGSLFDPAELNPEPDDHDDDWRADYQRRGLDPLTFPE